LSGKLVGSKEFTIRGMLEAYLTSASSLDVKLKILIQTVMAEKRLIPQHKFDRTVQILKFLLHVFTIESPTEMFGNVFTAMESLIYLYHGEESCDIRILYNSLNKSNLVNGVCHVFEMLQFSTLRYCSLGKLINASLSNKYRLFPVMISCVVFPGQSLSLHYK
jgi:hypothetical protein